MISKKYSVPEVHCDHCKSSIEGAVGLLEGVTAVTVDIDGRTVDVSYEATVAEQDVVDAIEAQGYEVAR